MLPDRSRPRSRWLERRAEFMFTMFGSVEAVGGQGHRRHRLLLDREWGGGTGRLIHRKRAKPLRDSHKSEWLTGAGLRPALVASALGAVGSGVAGWGGLTVRGRLRRQGSDHRQQCCP